MFGNMLEQVRKTAPLIHNITNYVTVNDCANILLACGAAPIMADAPEEAEEITALCQGLVLNLGTLNARTIPSMELAGKKANLLGHPVVLDPVGAGASSLRTQTALLLLSSVKCTLIRGNFSEIKTLALGSGNTRGVDASAEDTITKNSLDDAVALAKTFAAQTGAVIAITGAIDIVADAGRAYCIYNGVPEMGHVTGTGCQLSAMAAAYLAANPDVQTEAAAAAVCAMGYCGELAKGRLAPADGNATYRNYIIDAVYRLEAAALDREARYEIR